jgi:phosphoribosylaminoimidazolecarboxamide formyltransferase/IMP cyclohydrolase
MPNPKSSSAKKKKRYAVVSVSDKTRITDMAKYLVELNFEIISTGGTAKAIKEAGIPVTHVSEVTGFPEIMDGRVKTLHPCIHGGLLGRRDSKRHAAEAEKNGIKWIDLVIVNLYPFEATIKKKDVPLDEVIENIDIGGPCMIRAAAKNHPFVTVVVDPADYKKVLEEFNIKGETSLKTRQRLAVKAFAHTARYDSAIDTYLSGRLLNLEKMYLKFDNGVSLRYGENPHQKARFYKQTFHDEHIAEANLSNINILHGREMSFNNYVDANAALEAVKDLHGRPGAVIVKHTNPCGFAIGASLDKALEAAWAGDPVSAFGSVIAVNQPVDLKTARRLAGRFVEILMAPEFRPDALEFLRLKSKDIRIIQLTSLNVKSRVKSVYHHIIGGVLEQSRDILLTKKLQNVTEAPFPAGKKKLAEFAYKAVKNIKSNAITLAYEYESGQHMILGMGAGQPNRVDAVRKLCATKAEENIRLMFEKQKTAGSFEAFKKKIFGECVLASDAFFPFDDNIHHANEFGVRFIVQPGGSKRDDEVINACNRYNIAMAFTGVRHFKH